MTTDKATFNDVWATLKEMREAMRETNKEIQEAQKETAQQFKETDRRLRASKEETDRQLRESLKRSKQLEELFTGQWGKLVESLVEGKLVKMLRERNISVDKTMTRIKRRKKEGIGKYEFDILAVNGDEVVVVEVKTTLRPNDTDYFIKKLGVFRDIFPEYGDKKIHGAVAYLREDSHADLYSERKGLFVIRATGDSASITNDKKFAPKAF